MRKATEINRNYFDKVGKREKKRSIFVLFKRSIPHLLSILFIPILFGYGIGLVFYLKIRLIGKRNKSKLHREAIKKIDKFIYQYPMHLYPIILKSMGVAFLKMSINKCKGVKGSICELAVGEGTLTSRVFVKGDNITCFDIDPYNLIHTKRYDCFSRSIVADCISPPIKTTSLIISNNFLHHVKNKDKLLSNWSHIAKYIIFNESTPYWSSSFFFPKILNSFGFTRLSEKWIFNFEKEMIQSLWGEDKLVNNISKYYEVVKKDGFFNHNIFFLSSVFSALMFCHGPPTPRFARKILISLFRPLTRYITHKSAELLIFYDSTLKRDKDCYNYFVLKSRFINKPLQTKLKCPNCNFVLNNNKCEKCNTYFKERDGLLYLLPKELSDKIVVKSNVLKLSGRHL